MTCRPRRAASELVALAGVALVAGLATGVAADVDPLGRPFPAVLDLADLSTPLGVVLEGAAPNDAAGASVAGIGDMNGDGFEDAIVGAPDGIGRAYVVFGRDHAWPRRASLASLDGRDGFRLFTSHPTSDEEAIGTAVSAAGDLNGDGFADALIGAPGAWPGDPHTGPYPMGVTYTVFGRNRAFPVSLDLSQLDGSDGFRTLGPCIFAQSGSAVAGRGGSADINGDGVDDIAIGAAGAFEGYCYGDSYVVFGRSAPSGMAFPDTLAVDALDGSRGFVFNAFWFDNGGGAAAAVGNVNGDGLADAIFGTPREYTATPTRPYGDTTGATYVIFGRDATAGATYPDQFDRNDLDGDLGVQILGTAAGSTSGASVAVVGDLNGDGLADLAIGEPGRESDDPQVMRGAVVVVFGRPDLDAAVDLAALGVGEGFRLIGAEPGDALGLRIARAGDVNGDGRDDLIVTDSNAAYVLFGRDAADPFAGTLPVDQLDGRRGFAIRGPAPIEAIAGGVDLNGDGRSDLMLGMPSDDTGGVSGAGSVALVFGRTVRTCRVDIDRDGDLTIFDFLAFQNLFDAGDARADFDADGQLTIFDFLAFQNAFDDGCG
ncbi:MAG: integrin alpha [Phycisphaerales bacterium]